MGLKQAYSLIRQKSRCSVRLRCKTRSKLFFRGVLLQSSVPRFTRTRKCEEQFFTSAAVLLMEVSKTLLCLGIILCTERTRCVQTFSTSRFPSKLFANILGRPLDTLKTSIPAIAYSLQNNLLYVGVSHLDAATFSVGFIPDENAVGCFAAQSADSCRVLGNNAWTKTRHLAVVCANSALLRCLIGTN